MDILERLLKGAHVSAADPGFEKVSAIIDKNSLLEQDLNCNRHTHAEQHQLLEKIMQQKIDPTTQVSLPFHTDFGPHIFWERIVLLIKTRCLLTLVAFILVIIF
ncbi:hypothetical protein [Fructilactobacillus fructivorans]|uniref:hypothetical protein n=1 Tax=Fructilactobacillus fructivorans TaxID=1614 RepID=UPI000714028B|nr:hypothetical protein [Fructilactobacillus fructivorans]KRN42562.1 hexapeptide repeat-containing acetyltransferase [Fructilactobacillus fructivorans]